MRRLLFTRDCGGRIMTNRRETVSTSLHARVFRRIDQRQNFIRHLPHGRLVNFIDSGRRSGTSSRLLLSPRPVFYVALVVITRL